MHPVLALGGGTGQTCIYLGQAIQIINTTGTSLYSYPVFGLRTVYSGATDTGETPSSISGASPSPAVDSSDNLVTPLINTYNLDGSLKTKWAKINGGAEKDLIGLYANASDSNNTSGNEVTLYKYDTTYDSVADVTTTYDNIKSCVRSGCGMDTISGNWQLCVGDNTRSALVNAFMSATGVNTSIAFKNTVDCS